MKKYLLFLFILLTTIAIGQKNPNDKWMKKAVFGNKTIFFILPQWYLNNTDSRQKAKIDITLVYIADSALTNPTLNISIISPLPPDTMALQLRQISTQKTFPLTNCKRLFVEPRRRKQWESRYTATLPLNSLLAWLASPTDYVLDTHSTKANEYPESTYSIYKMDENSARLIGKEIEITIGYKN